MATASSPWRTCERHLADLASGKASIWPRHHRRGEPDDRLHGAVLVLVASIWPRHHRRGELRQPTWVYGSRTGFNLATASSPWRTRQQPRRNRGETAASIWPRHHRRGEQCHVCDDGKPLRLLQFGHGIIAVENSSFPGAVMRLDVASIWPRHHRRGEPRVALPAQADLHRLQFGHGIIAVENARG